MKNRKRSFSQLLKHKHIVKAMKPKTKLVNDENEPIQANLQQINNDQDEITQDLQNITIYKKEKEEITINNQTSKKKKKKQKKQQEKLDIEITFNNSKNGGKISPTVRVRLWIF